MGYLMKRKEKSYSFIHRIMSVYLLLLLFAEISIGIFAYSYSMNLYIKGVVSNYSMTLEQLKNNLDVQVIDVERIAKQVFSNYRIQLMLKSKDQYIIYKERKEYLLPIVQTYLDLSINPIHISLYTRNDAINEYYNYQANPMQYGSGYSIYRMSRIEEEPWLLELSKSDTGQWWIQTSEDKEFGNISHVRKLIFFDTFKTSGYVRVITSTNSLFKDIKNFDVVKKAKITLFNRKTNQIIFSNQMIKGEENWVEADAKKYLSITKDVTNSDWKLIAEVPLAELEKDSGKILLATFLVCFLSFIIFGIATWLITKFFGYRVNYIVEKIQLFKDGDFDQRIDYNWNDEFSYISDALNEMTSEINHLIQEVYCKETEKKQAELDALQAQINPHFLYNTLSAINSLANMGQTKEVSIMISELVKFYRLTLNKGRTFIRISDEIQQVKAYLDIQSIKYGNRFDVTYEIDPLIIDYMTVKIILQPFVENILNHAWDKENISIMIRAYSIDEDIQFEVIDNGLGMTEETIEGIFKSTGTNKGYGIKNVDERIKIYCGNAYGIQIESTPGEGTTIQIRIMKKSYSKVF